MLFLTNLLFRGKDPTSQWRPDPSRLTLDIAHCSLAGAPLGGSIELITALGPSSDARKAARGYPEWHEHGLSISIEDRRLADFAASFVPDSRFGVFDGRILCNGAATKLGVGSTEADVIALLGKPFARSAAEWDSSIILFYETSAGEAQFAIDKEDQTLVSIECVYEPELSDAKTRQEYGLDMAFPEEFRRSIGT